MLNAMRRRNNISTCGLQPDVNPEILLLSLLLQNHSIE